MQLSVRRTVAMLGAVGLAALAVPTAFAHDVVLGGNPADGETVEQFPDEVVLEFSGIPKEGFNTLAVTEVGSGDVLFTGEPTVDGRNVSLQVPDGIDAGPGDYRIGFQITSSDGHSTRGMTTFSVAGDAAAAQPQNTPAGSAESAAQSSEQSQPADEAGMGTGVKIAIAVAAVLALIAAAVAAVAKNRKRDNLRTDLDEQ